MKQKIEIIPAILATTEEEYQEKLQKIEISEAFFVNWVHIDLMDNKFVQNKSVTAETVLKYPTNFKKEVHLMVEDPYYWIDKLKPADIGRFIIHYEVVKKDPEYFENHIIAFIRSYTDSEIGLAFNPETKIEDLGNYLEIVDLLLLMGVYPGFGGQEFIPETVGKVKKVKEFIGDQTLIGVDGGMNEESVKLVIDAGANHIVVGSYILQGDVKQNLESIWDALRR